MFINWFNALYKYQEMKNSNRKPAPSHVLGIDSDGEKETNCVWQCRSWAVFAFMVKCFMEVQKLRISQGHLQKGIPPPASDVTKTHRTQGHKGACRTLPPPVPQGLQGKIHNLNRKCTNVCIFPLSLSVPPTHTHSLLPNTYILQSHNSLNH